MVVGFPETDFLADPEELESYVRRPFSVVISVTITPDKIFARSGTMNPPFT